MRRGDGKVLGFGEIEDLLYGYAGQMQIGTCSTGKLPDEMERESEDVYRRARPLSLRPT